MRVLHVGKFFPPHPGGIERCTADLCAALSKRGANVAVLAHADPGAPASELRAGDVYDVTLTACHGRLLYAPLSPGFPVALARTIRRFRPDLLHLHLPNTSAFCALLLPAARRIPWIVHWHADIPLDSQRRLLRAAYRLYKPWEQALLRRSAAVIATSVPYRDSSPALAPWLDRTHVIPLGIAASRGSPDSASAPSPNGLRVLAVGRLSYFKGIDILLRAIAPLSGARLTVIGDGECRPALERLARELGIESRVTFTGRIDMDARGEARIEAAYRDADVFCLPSIDRAESFGLVLLEAMRAGLPVVASAISGSGVGYVVRGGETGLLVPPANAEALTQAIGHLGADAALRARLGAAGRQRWLDEFTLDRAADRVLQLYQAVLRPGVRAAAAPAG